MSTFLQESFTDTDGTVLSLHTGEGGVTYTQHPSFTIGTFTIENNRVSRDTSSSTAVYYASVVSPTLFYEVSCSITDKSALARTLGVFGWMDTASDTMLGVRRFDETTWQFLKIINNVGTTIDTAPETFSAEASHTLRLRRIPETNDFEWFVDGVSQGVFTVNDAEFQSIGKVGIRATGGAGGPTVGYHLDNLSATSLTAPNSLFRGRNFPFFDDEEVNRFEFWPAIAVATAHERAASLNATADIASSGEFFSVFERAASIDATSVVETVGQRVVERSAILDATALISTSGQFFSILERSAAFDAAASVTVGGARVVDRSTSVESTASIETSGESFSVFESSVSLSVTAIIESSGISFSVSESAVSISTAASIEVAGVRIVERSSSLLATATVESAGTFFSVVNGAAQFDATATIESSVEFFSILERQVAIDASAMITTARQVELARAASFSTVADIAVTGGIEGGIFEHERSATITATGAVESSAIFFSIVEAASAITASASVVVSGLTTRERSVSFSAATTIVTTAQRDLQRSVTISATTQIQSSGGVSGEAVERTVSLSTTATITVSATFQHPTPPRRTFVVELEQRTVTVPVEDRIYLVPVEEKQEVVA